MLLTLTSACAPQGFGPVTQSQFLQIMGLEARLGQLLANVSSQEEAERLVGEAQRLVGPDEMGQIYKALAITAPRPSRTTDQTCSLTRAADTTSSTTSGL